jgi:phage repressor protein C with HTH and peptisase S24 domain
MVVSTDPVELVPRPWYMHEVRDGFAVLVVGESMVPAFEPGDMAVVNPRLPVMRGKDVILIADEQQGEFRASIKRLERWDSKHWHLRQFNPPRGQKPELTWAKKDWPKALRVVGKYYGG